MDNRGRWKERGKSMLTAWLDVGDDDDDDDDKSKRYGPFYYHLQSVVSVTKLGGCFIQSGMNPSKLWSQLIAFFYKKMIRF